MRPYRYHWLVLALCALTLSYFSLFHPFQRTGPELLVNGDFSQGIEGWKLDGSSAVIGIEDAVLTIDHGRHRHSTALSQCKPAETLPERLILTAEISSHSIAKGSADWHLGRVDLVGYDSQGKGIYHNIKLVSVTGNQDWVSRDRVFTLSPGTEQRCVEIALYAAPGRLQLRHLSLREAEPLRLFAWGRGLLLSAWVLLGLRIGSRLYLHYRDRIQGRYLLFLLPLVLGGILMPHETRAAIENQIISLWSGFGFGSIAPSRQGDGGVWDLWPAVWDLSKISHLIGFALLGIVVFSERRRDLPLLFFGLLLLALSSECLQFFVPDRTPRLSDLVVDSLGVLLGWLIFRGTLKSIEAALMKSSSR